MYCYMILKYKTCIIFKCFIYHMYIYIYHIVKWKLNHAYITYFEIYLYKNYGIYGKFTSISSGGKFKNASSDVTILNPFNFLFKL